LFKQEGAESDIPEIKALVDETLPKLEERLEKARALASTYGKGHQGDG
jgi:putative membrane protein